MTNYRRHTAVLIILVVLASPPIAIAQSPTEIQQQINNHNSEIKKLDEEIAEYQKQLSATSAKKNTLQAKLDELNLSIKKKNAEISQTQNKIDTTKLEIKQLAGNIETARQSINVHSVGLGESIRALSIAEDQPIAAQVLSEGTQDVWNDIVVSQRVQSAVRTHIKNLAAAKQEYTDTKTATEAKQAQLVKQQQTLKTQQGSLNAQKTAQNDLLKQTQSQEANYQKILAEKQLSKKEFENALRNLKAQLTAADTSAAPSPATGILAWPLDSVSITQSFGDTAFSRTAAYNGNGHNGVDFSTRSSEYPTGIGMPVKAALAGRVIEINQGVAPSCQYGKWILIRHANGLSTLYAHLSTIQLSEDQNVFTGQVIGYSGNTGYATGPHFHFTVYITSAISFIQYKCNSGPTVSVPVSPFNGYLNPLNYLP